jgi:hypothetical protein
MLLPRWKITRRKLCFYYTFKFGVISIKQFTHIELLIYICTHWISTSIYDIKWISACIFEFKKKTNKQSLKNDPGTQQKLGMLYRIKHCVFRKLCVHKLRQLTHKLNKVRRTLCKVCKWASGVFTYIIS